LQAMAHALSRGPKVYGIGLRAQELPAAGGAPSSAQLRASVAPGLRAGASQVR
jgi:hypothetical protein